jgi:pimeloyl-ACP methyl ester carboxylesterase
LNRLRQAIASLVLASLIAFPAKQATADDPFLEPQPLPPELPALTLNDSQTGESFVIRLGEDRLPMHEDFFGAQGNIPFSIEGTILDSPSGSQLHAWTFVPKADARGIDILLLHGNGGNILTNLGTGIRLSRLGYRVTIVDYSGYGWSTGEATRDNVLLDGVAALERFADEAKAAGRPLVLFGQSLGGHLAVVIAAEHPDKVDALVIEGAFSSHRDIAAHFRGGIARLGVSEPYSAEKRMEDVQDPVLVIHSPDDAVVPFDHGQRLYELAGEPKEFLEIDGPHLAGIATHGGAIDEAMLRLLPATDAGRSLHGQP